MTSRKYWAILSGMSEDWAEDVTKRIADEIKRLRGSRSGQWLSDRTAAMGHRVSRSTISEIETGRRKSITVSDLILLALALNTTPVALVYPGPYDERIQVVPKAKGTEIWAAQWFSGLIDGDTIGSLATDFETRSLADDTEARQEYKSKYDENLRRLRTARQVWDLDGRRYALMAELRERKKELSGDEIAELRDAIADFKRRADELRSRDAG